MPAKNARKQYLENGYYHIYNRGVEKRTIFLDMQDYSVFLSYLKEYLMPKDEKALQEKLLDPHLSFQGRAKIIKLLRMNNFAENISLFAYCLMPNHFHFLLKQKAAQSIDTFMNSMATRYTMYFNRKYKRIGPLYQGVYKAVLVTTDEQFLHLSRYIHKQALNLNKNQPCSYAEYVGIRKTDWIFPQEIFSYFSKKKNLSYESFTQEKEDFTRIEDLTIEEVDEV